MAETPHVSHSLGIDWNATTLKAVQLTLKRGQLIFDHLFEFPLHLETSSNALKRENNSSENQLFNRCLRQNFVVTALPSSAILVRQLEVKLTKLSDIDAVLSFQAEPLLPYPIDQAILDRQVLTIHKESSSLTLFSAKKDYLKGYLDECQSLAILPELVSCVPFNLALFASIFAPSKSAQFIIHLNQQTLTGVLAKEGQVLASQTLFQGYQSLVEAYQLDHQHSIDALPFTALDFAHLLKEAAPSLSLAVENLRLELTRMLYSLAKQAKGQEIEQILFTGEGATSLNLASTLCQSLNKPLILPLPPKGFNLTVEEVQRLALPIGAALTVLPLAKESLNFRQQEFAYPYPWKRYKKPLMIYSLLCLSLALAFYFFGLTYIQYQEDELREQFSTLLQSLDQPYDAFDRAYMAKVTGKSTNEEDPVTPLALLSQEAIAKRLDYLEQQLKVVPTSYPLLPNIPVVSDVLTWLSTHPNVAIQDAETKQMTSLLQLENFSYTLVKRPEITKKQEKYQVKVELEFSSLTPKLAREFHDALISPNAFVDPKTEVKWSTNRGLYRASFFLKDKTSYLSS